MGDAPTWWRAPGAGPGKRERGARGRPGGRSPLSLPTALRKKKKGELLPQPAPARAHPGPSYPPHLLPPASPTAPPPANRAGRRPDWPWAVVGRAAPGDKEERSASVFPTGPPRRQGPPRRAVAPRHARERGPGTPCVDAHVPVRRPACGGQLPTRPRLRRRRRVLPPPPPAADWREEPAPALPGEAHGPAPGLAGIDPGRPAHCPCLPRLPAPDPPATPRRPPSQPSLTSIASLFSLSSGVPPPPRTPTHHPVPSPTKPWRPPSSRAASGMCPTASSSPRTPST